MCIWNYLQVVSRYVLLQVILVACVAVAQMDFDCHRDGIECNNQGRCVSASDCVCSQGFTGYNCKVPDTSTVVPCDNAAVCQNGAICRKNALQQDQCFCTPEYYGEFCDIPRVYHTCQLTGMTIVVSPHGKFLGYVYVQGNEPTDPKCALSPGNATIIPYGSCGGINVSGNQSLTVLIRYNKNMLTNLDQEVTFTCTQQRDGHILPMHISVNNIQSAGYRTFETTAQIPEGVSMSLLNAAATSVFQEAHIHRLGDTVSLVLTLDTNGNEFQYLQLESLAARGNNDETLPIFENGCPLVGARSILVDAEIEEVAAEKRVVIKMNVFKFPSTNQVRLISNIRVCTSNNKDACTSLECGNRENTLGDFGGLGRRKRSVDDFDFDILGLEHVIERRDVDQSEKRTVNAGPAKPVPIRNLNLTMFVRDTAWDFLPSAPLETGLSDPSAEVSHCMQSVVFLLPLVMLAGMLIVSMGMTLFFCIKVTKINRQQQMPSYK